MTARFPAAEHEGRQRPGLQESWCEAFSFEFNGSGPPGGFLTLVLRPNLGQAWLWAFGVTADDQATVADLDLQVPDGLTVSSDGLEAELACEQPLLEWTVRLESPSLAMDLRFETTGDADATPEPPSYALPCRVRGRLRVGAQEIDFDGWGWRGHLWTDVDWSNLGTRVLGRSDDGDRVLAMGAGRDTLDVTIEPVASTTVEAAAPDGSPVPIRRELGRLRTGDGRSGWGWLAGPDQPSQDGASQDSASQDSASQDNVN